MTELKALFEHVANVELATWVALSFIPIPVLFTWALWRADRGAASLFKFVHFVSADTGRGSPYALGYTMLVVVCAWGVWALIVLDRLTEWYMTLIIGAFVIGSLGARSAQIWSRMKGNSEPMASAGDLDAPPADAPPLLTRETTTTETLNVPALDDGAPKKGKR